MKVLRRSLALFAIAALAGACQAPVSGGDASALGQSQSEQAVEEPMKIRIVTADRAWIAVLEDSASGRDFAALLPLELMLSDYNRTEKIADLPQRLSTEDAPEGVEPKAGDVAYYAPWGNLAIFYRHFGYSRGLVRLGRLEGGTEALAKLDGARVRIEPVP